MNFQNIPRDLKVVKRAFVPKRGAFSFFDYSQIEPRLFAYFTAKLGDDTVAQWYREGRDVYVEIAARVYRKPAEQVTAEERQQGKVWFLMSLYMAGPKKISQETGMPLDEAREFYKAFHEGLPQIRMLSNPPPRSGYSRDIYVPGMIELIYAKRGYIKTPWGRHLHAEQWGEHKLLNKLIQGSAADLMKAALVRTDEYLRGVGYEPRPVFTSRMVSVIHDELIFDGPEGELELLNKHIPPLMREDFLEEVIPIEIDHEVSITTWADKAPYDNYLEWKEAS